MKIAKADLVPTTANLLPEFGSFSELAQAATVWCEQVNARTHRETNAAPIQRLSLERLHLRPVPAEPFAVAVGSERLVEDDQTIRFSSVRYSTPPGHVGTRVWCRVAGEELVITARGRHGLVEICRHQLSTPGNPRIRDEHYPDHPGGRAVHQPTPRPRTEAEIAFLAIGPGAQRWLIEAGATGAVRVRAKMGRAVELAAVLGATAVDEALGLAAVAGRFGEDDLASIADHLAAEGQAMQVVHADEAHSVQPGTGGWQVFGE